MVEHHPAFGGWKVIGSGGSPCFSSRRHEEIVRYTPTTSTAPLPLSDGNIKRRIRKSSFLWSGHAGQVLNMNAPRYGNYVSPLREWVIMFVLLLILSAWVFYMGWQGATGLKKAENARATGRDAASADAAGNRVLIAHSTARQPGAIRLVHGSRSRSGMPARSRVWIAHSARDAICLEGRHACHFSDTWLGAVDKRSGIGACFVFGLSALLPLATAETDYTSHIASLIDPSKLSTL